MSLTSAVRQLTILGVYPRRHIILANSSVAVAHTGDTLEFAHATVAVPAGLMGLNGNLRVTTLWSCTSSANVKTFKVRLGGVAGTQFTSTTLTTSGSLSLQTIIRNRNSAASQVGGPFAGTGFGGTNAAPVTGAINTANAADLVLAGQLALSSETITLESYLVELIR